VVRAVAQRVVGGRGFELVDVEVKRGRGELSRRASSFAISKGRKEEPAGGPEGGPDMDDPRMEQALQTLAAEAEGMNEEDPRQAVRLMRKLFDATGMPMNAGMEEALRRMEAGEDPEKIEAEMGDVFEQDPLGGGEPREAGGVRGLRRRLPPSVDPELHEM